MIATQREEGARGNGDAAHRRTEVGQLGDVVGQTLDAAIGCRGGS